MTEIKYENGITFVSLPKKSKVDDFILGMKLLFTNEDYQRSPYSLWKIYETELDVTPTDLKTIKDFVLNNRGNIPKGFASVVVKSKQQRGIILIYELISFQLPVELRIFESYEEGYNWLLSELPK